MEQDRLSALRETKLRALVASRPGAADAVAVPFGHGAALVLGDEVWALGAPEDQRVLGRLLAVCEARRLPRGHLVLDDEAELAALAGRVARRAALLRPTPAVWQLRGRELVPAEPAPRPEPAGAPAGAEDLIAQLQAAGLEVVVEHGVVHGEVFGLEVARVHGLADGRVVLDVGVGRFDQAAGALLYQDLPTARALQRVITEVGRHRRPGAEPHPINRLARERWLRASLVAEPGRVGLVRAEPIAPIDARHGLRDPGVAAAVGWDGQGRRVLVACAVGVDLELVPVAADLAGREQPERILLVTPSRDRIPVQERLATRLSPPAELVVLDGDWRD